MKKVLFVCTGNTCRSPMAEAIFNHETDGKGLSAISCGIYADGISPISANASEVLMELGIKSLHVSTPMTRSLIDEADYVIGMTANHAHSIISMFPDSIDKVYTMPKDISDPYGGSIEVYRNCRDEIKESINAIISAITGDKNV